jgi:hypothetical protein
VLGLSTSQSGPFFDSVTLPAPDSESEAAQAADRSKHVLSGEIRLTMLFGGSCVYGAVYDAFLVGKRVLQMNTIVP